MCLNSFGILVLSIFLCLFVIGCGHKIPLISNTGHPIAISANHVTSWKELNEQNIIIQRYDYSCGAASLATLMKYYFKEDVTEDKILDIIKTTFTSKEYKIIENIGLSFLELQIISRKLGYQSASIRLHFSALSELSGPVIVLLQDGHYRHFVVLRGVVEDRVFLADPSRGNIRISIQEFLNEWKGEVFVLGKEGFGTPAVHDLAILYSSGFRNEVDLLRQPLMERPVIKLP